MDYSTRRRQRDLFSSSVFDCMQGPPPTRAQTSKDSKDAFHGAFDPKDYQVEQPNMSRAELQMTSSSFKDAFDGRTAGTVQRKQAWGEPAASAPLEEQMLHGEDDEQTDVADHVSTTAEHGSVIGAEDILSQPIVPQLPLQQLEKPFEPFQAQALRPSSRNPILDGEPSAWNGTPPRSRRGPPPNYGRAKRRDDADWVPGKAMRPAIDTSAAGVVSATKSRGHVPGHRPIRGPPEGKEEGYTSHRRMCKQSYELLHNGNPITQREGKYVAPPHEGIKTFAKSNRESDSGFLTITDVNGQNPAAPRQRGEGAPSSRVMNRNPITGYNTTMGDTIYGVPRQRNADEMRFGGHKDVINYGYAGALAVERNTGPWKVTDSVAPAAIENEQGRTEQGVDSHRAFLLNKARAESAHSVFTQHIYDDPNAVP